jgi:hypothetical protein
MAQAMPSPGDGNKYHVAPYWLEEIAMLLRHGASDAEILAELRTPSGEDPNNAQVFPLPDDQAAALLQELRSYLLPPRS